MSMETKSNPNSLHCRFLAARFLVILGWVATMVVALSSPSQGSKFPNRKVALVTGSNKGIGYEIAKNLLSHNKIENKGDDEKSNNSERESENTPAFVCLLGCRNEGLGKAAAERLASETRNEAVDVVTIDLMDHESIAAAVSYIRDTYGRCDVLINNAAVCYNDPTLYGTVPHTPFAQQAKITIATNFFGTLQLTRAMLPLLEQSTGTARIVNIASSAGRLSIIPSAERRAFFSSESLKLDDLEASMTDFVRAAQDGRHASEGWPNTGYGVSKVGIIAMTKILARRYSGNAGPRMMVNSVDPGYCATDQNNHQGVIPAQRGAVTPYLLATLTDENDKGVFNGKHWYQEREIEW